MRVSIVRQESGLIGRVIVTLDPDIAAARAAMMPGAQVMTIDARELRQAMPTFVDVEKQLEHLLDELPVGRSAAAKALRALPREQRKKDLATLVSELPELAARVR